jgi:glycosyltransferase involved in cell wall biosynthesis
VTAASSGPPPAARPAGREPLRLSVCIPAYNRADRLPALLDSVVAQDYPHWDVVICEDRSPQRAEIRAVVERYAAAHPGRFRYFENAENLGYDGNFRELIRRASGEYCFIMGNDDVVAPGALATVAEALVRHPGVGVVLRTYAFFRDTPDNIITVSRYWPDEMLFAPGLDTVVTFFRRLVSMSGIVLHREEALRHETDRFDGTLFYQLHLAAHILMHRPGLFLPQVLAYFRKGGVPEFGASARERGKWIPGQQPPETSLRMLQAHLDIAAHVDSCYGVEAWARVHRDLGQHMYPTFTHQAHVPLGTYVRFYRDLMRMGFWRYPMFHAYGLGVRVLGSARTDALLFWLRRRLGHTPTLGARPRPVAVRAVHDATR